MEMLYNQCTSKHVWCIAANRKDMQCHEFVGLCQRPWTELVWASVSSGNEITLHHHRVEILLA